MNAFKSVEPGKERTGGGLQFPQQGRVKFHPDPCQEHETHCWGVVLCHGGVTHLPAGMERPLTATQCIAELSVMVGRGFKDT